MPQDTQLALLDKLEEQERTVRVFAGGDVAAQEIEINLDLKFRLDVVSLRIPSLAERPEDIPVLFRHYVAQAAEQSGHVAPEISRDVLADLMGCDWTGNARALMRHAMRFVLGTEPVSEKTDQNLGLNEQLARVERSLLISTLQNENGRASEAAKRLKLPRKTFYDKLAKHGIRAEDYR
jgi:two-component system C4-dicarboxylate transport response regulator DctD